MEEGSEEARLKGATVGDRKARQGQVTQDLKYQSKELGRGQ